ncbi:MAG: Crp/Fnr family transcriptional regulator [Chloroflexi bacterium]|nr:Crp/Fnr family transcriptional regulator [Chloroflexota bacterium]
MKSLSGKNHIISRTSFLRSISYFSSLSEEEVALIDREMVERTFGKGQVLFIEGEPAEGLYVVRSGQIRVFKSSPEGRELVLLVARPGDTFNDVSAFDSGPNPASASALDTSTVYLIPRETLASLLATCPPAQLIINVLSARVRHLMTVVEDLSFRTVSSRLAKLLLESAVAGGQSSQVPRLTQDEMAAMVGSVRDVIGRVLRALEKTGAVRIEGHRILVVNPDLLRKMVQ